MNPKIKSAIAEIEGRIDIPDEKKMVELLTNALLHMKNILVYNSSFYFKVKNLLVPISDKEVLQIIRTYKDWCSMNAIAPEGRNTFYSKVTDYNSKISRGKFPFGSHNLNGFKGLKYKGNYNDEMYEQSYQDSPVLPQEGGDSE